MPTIVVHRKHAVDIDTAKQRVRNIVENVVSEYPKLGLKVTWNPDGSSATATGKGFVGQFHVDGSAISVKAELSLIATPFRSRVESTLTHKLDAAFPEKA